MATCFNGNTLPQATQIIQLLLKIVEKAASQPTQAPVVTEGLCATCLLLKLAAVQDEKDSQFGNLWNIVLDMEKQIFVGGKFLAIANETG